MNDETVGHCSKDGSISVALGPRAPCNSPVVFKGEREMRRTSSECIVHRDFVSLKCHKLSFTAVGTTWTF